MAEDEYDPERTTSTGVTALDDALGGGLPRGHTVLVAGDSGTGKTVLSFQWLFEGAADERNGLYLAFTEQMSHTLQNMESLSFYDRSAVEDDRVTVTDMRRVREGDISPDKIIEYMEGLVTEHDAERLVIDSVTAIAYALEDKHTIRNFIYDLGTSLASLGVTTILTSEAPDEEQVSVYGVEEFIADTILHLHREQRRHQQHRTMDIVKVRGHDYAPSQLTFSITGDGIDAVPHLDMGLVFPASEEVISTGIPTLDELLDGGIFRGSSTLIAGPTGSGKSTVGWHFATAGAEAGERSLYVSFEESRDELFRDFAGFGLDTDARKQSEMDVLARSVPTGSLERHMTDIVQRVQEDDVQRVVIDSLSALHIAYGEDEFLDFVQRIDRLLKGTEATTMYLNQTRGPLIGPADTSAYELASKVNNIILLRYTEVEGELRPIMNIVKARGATHSTRVHGYSITDTGMTIGPALSGYSGALSGEARRISATDEEQIRTAMQAEIGPMADAVVRQIEGEGLSGDAILARLDEWEEDDVLTAEQIERLRDRIDTILSKDEG